MRNGFTTFEKQLQYTPFLTKQLQVYDHASRIIYILTLNFIFLSNLLSQAYCPTLSMEDYYAFRDFTISLGNPVPVASRIEKTIPFKLFMSIKMMVPLLNKTIV